MVELNDGGIFSTTFDQVISMLDAYCSREHSVRKLMIDKDKFRETIEMFKSEREKIGGPIIERKIVYMPPESGTKDTGSDQKEE